MVITVVNRQFDHDLIKIDGNHAIIATTNTNRLLWGTATIGLNWRFMVPFPFQHISYLHPFLTQLLFYYAVPVNISQPQEFISNAIET